MTPLRTNSESRLWKSRLRARKLTCRFTKEIDAIRRALERVWGRVRWKMVAIILLMGGSTVLFAGLAVVIVNVVVRRESANVAEKQIQTLVQASGSIASAVLDNVDACAPEGMNLTQTPKVVPIETGGIVGS